MKNQNHLNVLLLFLRKVNHQNHIHQQKYKIIQLPDFSSACFLTHQYQD